MGKRVAAGSAFAAASAYITARLLDARSGGTALESVRTLPVVIMWIALLAVAGLIAIPVWRGIRSDQGLRIVGQWVWAIALAAVAGGVVIAFHALPELGLAETLTASSASAPPEWLLWIVLATLGPVAVVTRRLPVLRNVEAPLRGLTDQIDVGGGLTAVLVFGASVGLWIWSLLLLLDNVVEGPWHVAGLVLVLAATGLGLFYALFGRWRGPARAHADAGPAE